MGDQLKVRWQGCVAGGCNYELSIQLIITMVGKQVLNNVLEIVLPKLMSLFKLAKKQSSKSDKQWETDYMLNHDHTLYKEYIELAIQFGFITIFSTAFPLAPFCALINNLFEIRVDAAKYTREKTRPIPRRYVSLDSYFLM